MQRDPNESRCKITTPNSHKVDEDDFYEIFSACRSVTEIKPAFNISMPYLPINKLLILGLFSFGLQFKGLDIVIGVTISTNIPFSKRTPLTDLLCFTEILQSAIVYYKFRSCLTFFAIVFTYILLLPGIPG